jgi:hypothetical protein
MRLNGKKWNFRGTGPKNSENSGTLPGNLENIYRIIVASRISCVTMEAQDRGKEPFL